MRPDLEVVVERDSSPSGAPWPAGWAWRVSQSGVIYAGWRRTRAEAEAAATLRVARLVEQTLAEVDHNA